MDKAATNLRHTHYWHCVFFLSSQNGIIVMEVGDMSVVIRAHFDGKTIVPNRWTCRSTKFHGSEFHIPEPKLSPRDRAGWFEAQAEAVGNGANIPLEALRHENMYNRLADYGTWWTQTSCSAIATETVRTTFFVSVLYPVFIKPPDMAERWRKMAREHTVRGKQAHDARIAALMIAHGVAMSAGRYTDGIAGC